MPPPGRRRGLSSVMTSLLALVLLLFSPAVLAQSGVLGLDVGTEYIKAALVKPGIPLEIVLTKDSKRKETSAIAFKTSPQGLQAEDDLPERLYGGDALALAPRIPGDVYPNLKHLLGAGQPGSVETYQDRYPALDLFQHPDNGTLAFRSRSFPATHPTFSVEELLAMQLKTIRDNAETMAGSNVGSAVITVPSFFSADERRSLEIAAELAGLRVLGLITDGMAVGLNFATSRTFGNVDEGGSPEYHLVYDMGAGSTTATLLRMQGRRVKDVGRRNKTVQEISALGVGYDRTLGGDAFNDMIVADMVQKFAESSAAKSAGIEASAVKKHGRTMAKLFKEAERLRQVLSANTETSGFFESLYEDIDFRYKLSRTTYEEMSTDFALRVTQPIKDALEAAGLTKDHLTSVILHGGAVRTPFVQANLEAETNDASKLKSNVNADEAAVFGAAFKAAGLSPSFRVKEIMTNDMAMYPVTLHWKSGSKDRKQQIFVPTSQAGAAKQMPFRMLDDFTFSFGQKLPLVDVERSVLELTTTNLTKSVAQLINDHGCARENISTIVSMRIDPMNGLPEVTKGTVSCESTEAEKKGVMDGMKDMFGFGKKDQKSLDDDDDAELLTPLPDSTSSQTTSSSKSSASASSSSIGKSATDSKVPAKKIITIPLAFETSKKGLLQPSGDILQRIKDSILSLDRSDKARRLREELFNALESYTYRVRDLLTSADFTSFSTEAQRGEVESLLASTSKWLHGEGSTAPMDTIKEKLQSLRSLVDPVQQRKDEQTKRPIALESLSSALASASSLKDTIQASISSAAAQASASATAASDSALSAAAAMTSSASEAGTFATDAAGEAVSSATEAAAGGFESVTSLAGDAASAASDSATFITSVAGSSAESIASDVSEGASSASDSADAMKESIKKAIPTDLPDYDADAAYSSIMAQLSSLTASAQGAYSDSDLSRLSSAYSDAKSWLEDVVERQGTLSEMDVPAFLSKEVEERAGTLGKVVEELGRKARAFKAPKSSSRAKPTKSKTKSKTAKPTKSKKTSGASTASTSIPVVSVVADAGDGETGHDEL